MSSRYRVREPLAPHFLTSAIVGWLPVFARPFAAKIVLDSWQFLQQHKRIILFGFVIMENHVHWIASAADLTKEAGDFKSFTARRIIDGLIQHNNLGLLGQLRSYKTPHKDDREYQLWQEGSHPQAILSEEVMLQKMEYIHLNPVRRGYVDEPTHWRYSSARNYAGMPGLIPVQTSW